MLKRFLLASHGQVPDQPPVELVQHRRLLGRVHRPIRQGVLRLSDYQS